MYGRKIRYYRLKNGLTVEQLANKLSLTKAAISQYENDKRDPDTKMLNEIANVFDISWIKLLPCNEENYSFNHYSFRLKNDAYQNDLILLKDDIENRCRNQIEISNLLGLSNKPSINIKRLDINADIENNAKEIRKALGIPLSGPIYSLTNALEKLGIIMITFDCSDAIEGLNGTINKIPYIFFNSKRSVERIRFTILHEFCHLFFNHLSRYDSELEKYINKLTGHVLIPDDDLYEVFGRKNRNLNAYLRNSVSKEYKIAPSCLIQRLYEANIITKTYHQNFFDFVNPELHRNKDTLLNESSDNELPIYFYQQVYKALDEELISKSKAAELLNISLNDLMHHLVEG